MLKTIKEVFKELKKFLYKSLFIAFVSTVAGWGFANGFFSYIPTQQGIHKIVEKLWS